MENIRIVAEDEIVVHLTPDQGEAVMDAVNKALAVRAIHGIFGKGDGEAADHILQDFVNEMEEAINFVRNR